MLGTPPAFILSQDQTLMFKCSFFPASPLWLSSDITLNLLFFGCFDFSKLFVSVFRLTYKISCGLLCFVHLNLSRFIHCLIIKVHSSSLLSQFLLFLRQLVYFITSLSLCQQLFYFIFWCLFRHRFVVFSNSFILSQVLLFVNNFFKKFWTTHIFK